MKNTFKNPIILLLCVVVALSACLAGCDKKEPNFPVAVSDTTRSALELERASYYKDSELELIYQLMRNENASVNKLNDSYEIRCLRKDDDGYRVIYAGNQHILVLRFDDKANWIETDRLHSIYRMGVSRGYFDALKAGDPVTKVQTADPTCYFPFLADSASTDLETNHYTNDGYHTRILYDADFNIVSVTSEVM